MTIGQLLVISFITVIITSLPDRWRLVARIVVVTVNAACGGALSAVVFGVAMMRKRGYVLDIGAVIFLSVLDISLPLSTLIRKCWC